MGHRWALLLVPQLQSVTMFPWKNSRRPGSRVEHKGCLRRAGPKKPLLLTTKHAVLPVNAGFCGAGPWTHCLRNEGEEPAPAPGPWVRWGARCAGQRGRARTRVLFPGLVLGNGPIALTFLPRWAPDTAPNGLYAQNKTPFPFIHSFLTEPRSARPVGLPRSADLDAPS